MLEWLSKLIFAHPSSLPGWVSREAVLCAGGWVGDPTAVHELNTKRRVCGVFPRRTKTAIEKISMLQQLAIRVGLEDSDCITDEDTFQWKDVESAGPQRLQTINDSFTGLHSSRNTEIFP